MRWENTKLGTGWSLPLSRSVIGLVTWRSVAASNGFAILPFLGIELRVDPDCATPRVIGRMTLTEGGGVAGGGDARGRCRERGWWR